MRKKVDFMNMSEAVSSCLQKYADFTGRARRSEYWYWVLATGIVNAILGVIIGVIPDLGLLSGVFSLATLLPGLAVIWRRLHDIGKSGAWYFIMLVPIVGQILMLIWLCQDSDSGSNAYGPSPKPSTYCSDNRYI